MKNRPKFAHIAIEKRLLKPICLGLARLNERVSIQTAGHLLQSPHREPRSLGDAGFETRLGTPVELGLSVSTAGPPSNRARKSLLLERRNIPEEAVVKP